MTIITQMTREKATQDDLLDGAVCLQKSKHAGTELQDG